MSNILRKLSYGVYAVLAMDGERPTGCIVNTVFQISSQPALIAISMNKDNYTYEVLKNTGRFSVSILSEDTRREVITDLGFRSGRDTNKLTDVDYYMLDGLPVLREECSGVFTCDIRSMTDAGTHFVILAEVKESANGSEVAPMTYKYYHEAPEVVAEPTDIEEVVAAEERYVCDICGYVYEGDITKEPEDFRCPMCGVLKSYFKKK